MSQPVAFGNSRRTFAVCVLLCMVLIVFAQAGLGYVATRSSWPWFWLVGTPIGYLLIGGLGAFCAPQTPPSHLGPSGPGFLILAVIFLFAPAFLGVNLFGIALSTLGGLLGGTLRANLQRGERPLWESPRGQERANLWTVAVAIAVALAILAGVAAPLLSSGTFPAIH